MVRVVRDRDLVTRFRGSVRRRRRVTCVAVKIERDRYIDEPEIWVYHTTGGYRAEIELPTRRSVYYDILSNGDRVLLIPSLDEKIVIRRRGRKYVVFIDKMNEKDMELWDS